MKSATCDYPRCHRQAKYLNSWENEGGKHFGLVCATHDNELGHKNLINAGMTMSEILLFEAYLREVPDEMFYRDNCPDWPEWLELQKDAKK